MKVSFARSFRAACAVAVTMCAMSAKAAILGAPDPGAILDVRDVNTPANASASVLHTGGLTDGVSAFLDRGGNQLWENIPDALEGADYIEMSQNYADARSLEIEVDVADGTVLHLFIDQRQQAPFSWMTASSFGADWVNTGEFVFPSAFVPPGILFEIWSTEVPLSAGTYVFNEARTPAASFYGIAATRVNVPEPATMGFVGLGLLAMAGAKKRKETAA